MLDRFIEHAIEECVDEVRLGGWSYPEALLFSLIGLAFLTWQSKRRQYSEIAVLERQWQL